jgi:hypothetical protein
MGYKEKKNHDYADVADPSKIQEEYFQPSTIENIDTAFFETIKSMKIQTKTNRGFKPVPVIWTSAERSFQIKHNRDLRDSDDQFILPVITVERNSFEKSLSRKGAVFGNAIPDNGVRGQGGSLTVGKRINQIKTTNFANATAKRRFGQLNYKFNNEKVVYELLTIPLPVYIDVTYTIRIRGEYQQHLNDMVAPFVQLGLGVNYFRVRNAGHSYEAFVQSGFDVENNASALNEEERIYQTSISIKVLGYIVGAGKNDERPAVVKRENFVEISIGRERAILGDIPHHENAPEKYRS